MIRYAQLFAVGVIVAGVASPTEPTYGGPASSKPVITAIGMLHLPERADATIDYVMRSAPEERQASSNT
jgi:hypothetical protein